MTNKQTEQIFDKKTERLDIRISHDKKRAFNEACEAQSDTPSNAVRRFVNSYIRRSKRDDTSASLRTRLPRHFGKYAAIAATALLGVILAKPFLFPAPDLFAVYDADGDGIIELGEISENDHHLHRVLNIDGISGIGPEEFILKATMQWSLIEPEEWTVIQDVKTGTSHRRVTRSTVRNLPKGSLIPTSNPDKPFLTVEEFEAQDKSISELQNFNLGFKERRALEKKSSVSKPQFISTFVIFDLQDPEQLQIDSLEKNSSAAYSKSMTFSRSVSWVKGSKTPHHVMGQGSDKAVLTAAN